MPQEPVAKRVAAFVDGQNLFHAAREAFGYTFPNFDPQALALAICASQGWTLATTHFFTGIPDAADNPRWNHFWAAKLAVMGTRGVRTFSRPLRYRNQVVTLKDGTTTTTLVGQEKGIDVRIALDVVRLARQNAYDVALLFSQDQDLSEVADEVRAISRDENRWIKIASAFPISPASRNRRGVNKTDWLPIDRATYDACLDPNDYRLKPP
jgi:uncharacterized LabA/DUF88 family protein